RRAPGREGRGTPARGAHAGGAARRFAAEGGQMNASDRWFRLLVRLYPADFRDEMGGSVVEAYRDRARGARARRGALGVLGVCVHALVDTLRNGPGERARPAVSWRRTGNWGRDAQL